MKTYLLSLLAAASIACGPGVDLPLGGRDVAVDTDCPEPYRTWIAAEYRSEFGWHVAEVGEFTVRCGDTGPEGGIEEYSLGTNTVVFDPTKARTMPEFQTKQAVGHGAVHRLIYFGPHPAMATMHVCWFAYNESPPQNCYEGAVAQNSLMSPGGKHDWDGTHETFMPSDVPEYRITEADRIFLNAALTP